jgi:hypothetical protein
MEEDKYDNDYGDDDDDDDDDNNNNTYTQKIVYN